MSYRTPGPFPYPDATGDSYDARSPETHTAPYPPTKAELVSLKEAALVVDLSKPSKCGIYSLRKVLDRDDNSLLDDWLADPQKYPATWISDVLRGDGHSVSEFTIARHRRRRCFCVPRI